MIKHIVMWKLKDFAEGNSREENALRIKNDLEALISEIKEIKLIEVGINSQEAPVSNYDVVLVSEFEDFEGLSTYANHPSHLEVGGFIKKVTESRLAVDYEM